ncbi:hypothetical protein HDG38_006819 [Paraburkholderia sp. WSM4177]|nr:hypothetical protein [Paraburkholderia sp. WSM4177]MBB5488558.1 hypothetical protein [Paraburkholderia sp. WSM4180]
MRVSITLIDSTWRAMKFVLTDVLTLTDSHCRKDPFIPRPCVKDTTRSPSSRADPVYFSVRVDIFDLRLLPAIA